MKEISGLFVLEVDLEEGVRLLAEGVHGVWGMGLEEGHEPVSRHPSFVLRFSQTHVELEKDQLIGHLIDFGLGAESLLLFWEPRRWRAPWWGQEWTLVQKLPG